MNVSARLKAPGIAKPGCNSIYYGWVNLAIAAVAMVGTLPGRTQGLGLVTEPLIADFRIDRVTPVPIYGPH